MPQSWRTYHESRRSSAATRTMPACKTNQNALDGKKSQNGLPRIKLDPLWIAELYAAVRRVASAAR